MEKEEKEKQKDSKVEVQDKKPKVEVTQNGVAKVKKRQSTEEKELNPVKKKKIEEKDSQVPKKKSSITVKDLLREKQAELDLSINSSVLSDDKDLMIKDVNVNAKDNNSSASAGLVTVSKAISDTIESVIIAGLSEQSDTPKVVKSESVVVDDTSKDSSSSGDIAVGKCFHHFVYL